MVCERRCACACGLTCALVCCALARIACWFFADSVRWLAHKLLSAIVRQSHLIQFQNAFVSKHFTFNRNLFAKIFDDRIVFFRRLRVSVVARIVLEIFFGSAIVSGNFISARNLVPVGWWRKIALSNATEIRSLHLRLL